MKLFPFSRNWCYRDSDPRPKHTIYDRYKDEYAIARFPFSFTFHLNVAISKIIRYRSVPVPQWVLRTNPVIGAPGFCFSPVRVIKTLTGSFARFFTVDTRALTLSVSDRTGYVPGRATGALQVNMLDAVRVKINDPFSSIVIRLFKTLLR